MKAKIYKPTKNVMQSGFGNTKQWVLAYAKAISSVQENLMGYASSLDNSDQVKIYFATKEDAVSFASKKGLDFEIIEEINPKRSKKSYNFNFTKDTNLYYY